VASQHKRPLRASTGEPSEVLSEKTDLDALMEAILGDRVAAPHSVGAPAEVPDDIEPAVAAPPEPAAVTSPPPAKDPDASVVRPAVADNYIDAWGFGNEGPQDAREIASETDVVRQPGRGLRVAVAARRMWRDLLRGSISKQWMIVASLLAAALITVSAISLRGEPTQTTRRSSEAIGLMPQPPVQHPSAVRPRVSSEVEIRSPARKSGRVRVIGASRANRRPNPVTDDRTTPISVPTRDVTPPLTWPIVMAPDTLSGVAEASNGVSTSAQRLSGGAPEYPAALRRAGIGGSVEVGFTIASNGEVLDARSTTGPPQLRSIAEAAVRRWRYQAARVGTRPVESQTSVCFYFDPSANRPQGEIVSNPGGRPC
jgi:periplasmic protein TonB